MFGGKDIADDWPSREGAGLIAGLILGAACGPLLTRLFRHLNPSSSDHLYDSDSDSDGGTVPPPPSTPHKLVLCVRTDLGMTKGKIGAQCGHAALLAYKTSKRTPAGRAALREWEAGAQPKIALQIGSASQANALAAEAARAGVPSVSVHDAGRTQIAAGSMTVLAIGPAPDARVNKITGHLKLL